MGAGSRRASFSNFMELLTKAFGLLLQNVDELLQRIIVLNRPFDSPVHKTYARIGEGVPFIPISYFKLLRIVMVPLNLVGKGVKICFGPSSYFSKQFPHEHCHIDVTLINIFGTFFYLTTVLDGASRYIAHWEMKAAMTESDIGLIIERAREKFPGVNPRIISDNGPRFMAKDFKEYVRPCGMTHVRTSPYYPQSNGKIEAWHKSLKEECVRPSAPR